MIFWNHAYVIERQINSNYDKIKNEVNTTFRWDSISRSEEEKTL